MTHAAPPPLAIPSAHDRRRIAAAAAVDTATVLRAYRSDPVRSTVASRIVEAALTLGLPAPRIVVAP
jgi:hypothetical protein